MNSMATTTIVPLSAPRTTTRSTWQELPCKEMSNVELFAVIATDLKGMRIEAAAEMLLRAERKTR